jgi:hypothetical protein
MVNTENVLRKFWTDLCDVVVRNSRKNPETKINEFFEETIASSQPCRLSFETLYPNQEEVASEVRQKVKLILSSKVNVPDGSKIVVTRRDWNKQVIGMFEYSKSGIPAIYASHQEIDLFPFERWA